MIPRTVSVLACAAILAGAQTPAPPAPRPRPAAAPATPPAPRDLKYPPLRPMETATPATFTLPNGMKLFLIEDHELPVIGGVARIRTGNLFDPAGKVGVATLTGMVMRSGGTRQMTGEELDRKLEDVAGSVDAAIGESDAQVSFFSLAENAPGVLAAFRDVLTAPAFRIDKVDLAKMQLRSFVVHRNDDPRAILAREFPTLLYGSDTPYGWEIEPQHIDRIARADLVEFHKRYFFPKNAMLAVWGDFDSAAMKERLAALFAGWTAEQPPVPEFPKVEARPAAGVYLARKLDLPQTYFAIGHRGGRMDDKDYPALAVMAGILGGGLSSRLSRQIRVRMGNASAISAQWAAQPDHPGLFEISGAAKSLSIVATIKAIQEELERLRTSEPTAEEVRIARDGALDRLVFASDTRRKVLDRLLTGEYFGYPAEFPQQYQKGLAAVTGADVLRVAKERLKPADLTILVVGNPEDFMPPLENLGVQVREIDMTIPESKPDAAVADTTNLEQGKRILERWQQAAGGAEKLAAVKDYTVVRDVRVAAAFGGETLVETERWVDSGNMREDADGTAGKRAIFSNGKSGWVSSNRRSGALVGVPLKGMQSDLFRAYFALALSDRAPDRSVSALDENTIEISSDGGMVARVALQPETGLPQQISYTMAVATGPPLLVQEIYSKFGEVNGMRVPYEFTTLHDGELFAADSVKEFKVNAGLLLVDLERRP